MSKKCLYCYKPLDASGNDDFHESCSMDFFDSKTPPLFTYTFSQMAKLAKGVVERSIALPGVQAKLSLTLVKNVLKEGAKSRLTIVGALGGNYIFKPPSDHFEELPQNEHVTMRIAQAFGIRIVKCSLIRLHSGELSYITTRIDRNADGEKIHMIDMFQILEAFDKYKSSMEKVGKALGDYSSNTLLDKLYFFELTLFSFLTGNNDMHLKNFSMINSNGTWLLAPAYDLLNVAIANPDDTEELALTLEGKRTKLKHEHFVSFGEGLGLNEKQIQNTFNRFSLKIPLAKQWINDSFLSKKSKTQYIAILTERFNRMV